MVKGYMEKIKEAVSNIENLISDESMNSLSNELFEQMSKFEEARKEAQRIAKEQAKKSKEVLQQFKKKNSFDSATCLREVEKAKEACEQIIASMNKDTEKEKEAVRRAEVALNEARIILEKKETSYIEKLKTQEKRAVWFAELMSNGFGSHETSKDIQLIEDDTIVEIRKSDFNEKTFSFVVADYQKHGGRSAIVKEFMLFCGASEDDTKDKTKVSPYNSFFYRDVDVAFFGKGKN